MRKRELISRLKADRVELLRTYPTFAHRSKMQSDAERRLMLLHALENLLPEIIKKLEGRS